MSILLTVCTETLIKYNYIFEEQTLIMHGHIDAHSTVCYYIISINIIVSIK